MRGLQVRVVVVALCVLAASTTSTGSAAALVPAEPSLTPAGTAVSAAGGVAVGTPAVTLVGPVQVGGELTAEPVGFPAGDVIAYAWAADGLLLPGVAARLSLTPDLLGARVTVTATGRQAGQPDTTATATVGPVAPGVISPVGTPTVTGTLRVGRVLTAAPGTWSPAATLTYQWRADGIAIAGATAHTYTLQSADRTKHLSVQVRGTRTGYVPVTTTSAPTAAVDYGVFATAPTPAISGVVQIGSTVRAAAGTWSPSAVLGYQWRVGGVAVAGATGASFVIPTGYLGRSLSVTVTARRTGYLAAARTSAAHTVTRPFATAQTPTVSGRLIRVGWVVRASSAAWSPTATLGVQWRRNGAAITGGTSWTYRLTAADLGSRITATVTGRRAGYTTTGRSSAATAAVLAAPYGFTSSGTPATPPTAAYAPSAVHTLTDAHWARITAAGVWRPSVCPGGRTTFRRVDVPYWGLDGKVHRGYVVVNADVARSTAKIFDALYAKHFQMHRVEGIENWGGWEWLASMANASTAMNCRKPSEANSSNAYSPHAWGRALDFNPVQNPYINPRTGTWDPNPPAAATAPGAIRSGGVAWTVITSFRWYWSGNDSWHDYMHFDTGYPSAPRSGLRVVEGAAGHGR
ncbi:M15 family metallopeptidase [Terrabacter sp. 2RAF25]|uniref:M15 family metallopeptidase n=1 Tax=Terrabacter sp. 2RAF25 TaxID=3232998 RepID=UPI003F9B46AB